MERHREVVPASGLLQTSTAFGSGGFGGDFYFYSADATQPLSEDLIKCLVTFHNFEFQDPESEGREFVILFIGPPEGTGPYCAEVTQYKTETFPYFKMCSMEDLPQVGNLNNPAK